MALPKVCVPQPREKWVDEGLILDDVRNLVGCSGSLRCVFAFVLSRWVA